MSIHKLNTNGLGLRFKIKGEHVVFLTESGEEKATRPATPAELILWGELFQQLGEVEKANANLQKADEETLKLTRILQEIPEIGTNQLADPVQYAGDMLRSAMLLQKELNRFAEWLEQEFPGEMNEVEGVFGTVARLLRGRKGQGTPKQAKQFGGMAVREAQQASAQPGDAERPKPVLQEGP